MVDEPRQPLAPSKPPRFQFTRELADLSVPDFVREVQQYFMSTNPETGRLVLTAEQAEAEGLEYVEGVAPGDLPWVFPNNSTPQNFQRFLEFLRLFTVEISTDIDQPHIEELFGATDSARIRREFEEWQARLRQYIVFTNTAIALPKKAGTQFETFFATTVVNPLLLGLYPGDPVRKPADMATPLSLARQAQLTTTNMQVAWRKLGQDLVANAKALAETGASLFVPLLILGVAVGAAAYGYSKGK
jgi:hypothetical protein